MTIAAGDAALVQIVDAALAEAARKSGSWLVCRPGCTQCCYGSFPITPLDAWRLKQGLAELEHSDPDRARRVRERARQTLTVNDEDAACPALDPEAGTCDLYAARPITCRAFGPPVRHEAITDFVFRSTTPIFSDLGRLTKILDPFFSSWKDSGWASSLMSANFVPS